MTKIKKLQAWLNPTPITKRPRIDMDVTYEDGTRVRHSGLKPAEYRRITEALIAAWPEAWR